MKAVLCPVCDGSGIVPNGYYTHTTGTWTTTDPTPETCRGCGGKGWVEVSEDEDISEK